MEQKVKEVVFDGWKGSLWYEGEWSEKTIAKCAAVVTSRRMTSYGSRVIEKLVPRFVDDGFTIASGFMYAWILPPKGWQ